MSAQSNSRVPIGGGDSPQSSTSPTLPGRPTSDGDISPSEQDDLTARDRHAPIGARTPTGQYEDADVNIEDNDGDADELDLFRYSSPVPRFVTAPEPVSKSKRRRKSSSSVPTKKARKLVLSDEDEEPAPKKKQKKQSKKSSNSPISEDGDDSGDAAWAQDVMDSDPAFETSDQDAGSEDDLWEKKPSKKSSSQTKAPDTKKASNKQGKSSNGNAKRGRKSIGTKPPLVIAHEPEDVHAIDESYPATQATSAAASRAPSPVPTPPAPAKDKPAEPARKRKLPPIRKNKSSQLTTEAPRPVAPTATEPSIASTPLATTNATGRQILEKATRDVDLRDPSILKDIMHQSLPRSNPNRREKDERRKELNMLREQYAKQLEKDYVNTFDLQAQRDKIEKFEGRLKRVDIPLVYPNILGARMRHDWEEQNKRMEQAPSAQEDGEPEEGEVQ
jgi:hypothetical protein